MSHHSSTRRYWANYRDRLAFAALLGAALIQTKSFASEPVTNTDQQDAAREVDKELLRFEPQVAEAIKRSLQLIEQSSAQYLEKRKCFSCHHQGLPTLLLSNAAAQGFVIDAENLKAQVARTYEHLQKGKRAYLSGRGQGGKADTAGFALWALEAGKTPEDDVTQAVADYLLGWQKDQDHWTCTSNRPPSEASHFTTTYLAVSALDYYGSEEQKDAIEARRAEALKWTLTADPKDTEDIVFRLFTLQRLAAPAAAVAEAAEELAKQQRADGGWSQTAELDSDAYATGTAVMALLESDHWQPGEAAHLRAIKFLLNGQQDDGSWHVVSRSRPFQTYFESGFPHKKDQFISIAASCWATQALLTAGRDVDREKPQQLDAVDSQGGEP